MLIRFVVRNFRSFNEEVELSMIPGRARSHSEHVVRDARENGYHLLKTALLYGANAAGKSNLIEAIRFAQQLILQGTRPNQFIEFQRFRLDKEVYQQPARFEFEIKTQGKAYAYGFEITPETVESEWLYEISKTAEPKQLFDRTIEQDQPHIEINPKAIGLSGDDLQFLQFVARGTRPNQLFLSECNERNVSYFKDVWHWFQNTLSILPPPSYEFSSMSVHLQEDKLIDKILMALQGFNIDIADIRIEELEPEDRLNIPTEMVPLAAKKASTKKYTVISYNRSRYIIRRNEGGTSAIFKIMTSHRANDDSGVDFEFDDESDGTVRLIDLLSGVITSSESERVFIIDELDRSLHSLLSYNFLDFFLKSTQGSPNQLIVTTHESSLMDLDLLRRDEIWFVEKNKQGASELYSLEEFAPRQDKDIRQGYLHGRYGAIPIVRKVSDLGWD